MVKRKRQSTYTDNLKAYLAAIGAPSSGVRNPDKNDNAGNFLCDVYTWQTVKEYADKKLKETWSALEESGLIDSDDNLRSNLDPGEHIVCESETFSCLVTLKEPANRFDRDTFMKKVSTRFKVPADKVTKLAESCIAKNKASLSKKVIEVV